jgi:kumamolisin
MAKRQERVELKGSTRPAVPGAQDTGPANPNQAIEVSVILRRGSKPDKFSSTIQASTGPLKKRRYLTREQFARLHGASAADIRKVRAFAEQYGLQVVSEDRASRTVKLSGTVQAFNDTFGAELRHCRHDSGSFRYRSGALTIPANLEPIIEGVFGLDTRPQAKAHFRVLNKNISAHAATASYSPVQVAQAYNFPTNATGANQCIAIIELGGGYNATDIDTFFGNLGIPTPQLTSVSVDGISNSPTGNATGPDGEVDLDIEVAGSVAPGAQLAIYFAPNTDQGFIDAINAAVHDTKRKPSIISISWGGPESSWTEQSRNALNSACQDAATMGVTVVVACGDDGATDGSANGALTVDFPASSPNVLACGGTTLTLSGASIKTETVWNDLAQGEGGTGGGVSQAFPLPPFQLNAKVPKAPNGSAGRGVPDVAGDADPASGYKVFVDGQQSVIGGTSAVAPLWAGLLALINQSLGKNVGYANPLLYASDVESTFHDITSGNNGDYSAGPGWDACTGLGTPNGTAILNAMQSK